ncbi:MAG: hypothetical protein AB8B74_11155 [Crocinitomicaceae bacterium]
MNAKILNILLALLVYLPTCIFIPLNLYFVVFGIVIYLNFDFLRNYFSNLIRLKLIDKNFTYILLFSLVAFLLRLIDIESWHSTKDIYSFAYLFPLTYLIAKTLKGREDIFKYLIYFFIIEMLMSVVEYSMGINTVFSSSRRYRVFEQYDLLYFTRTFGLSPNSSGLSFKYIFGLILLGIVDFSKTKKIIIETIFIIGSILTFGRIALIVLLVFLLLRLFDELFLRKKVQIIRYLPLTLLILFFTVNPNWSVKQFTRGNTIVQNGRINDLDMLEDDKLSDLEKLELTRMLGLDKIDMSGRNEIWNTFLTYSAKNIHFGNKGKKMLFGKFHAHNSFIELLASVGIYLFVFMIFIFARNVTHNNYVFILTILALAMGQYLIFWGTSFFDIIFYYLLFFYKKNEDK